MQPFRLFIPAIVSCLVLSTTACLPRTMTAKASDHLDANRPVNVQFSVASRAEESSAHTSVTFHADGLQMLAPGGTVTVNGIPLVAAPLSKQGYMYSASVAKSARYELEYTLGPGKPLQRNVITERPFAPVLPATVSRGSGLVVAFSGAPLGEGERIFSDITGGDGPDRWGAVLRGTVEGNRVTFDSRSLLAARLGRAKLYVGVIVKQTSASGDYVGLHASGTDAMVTVTD